MKGIKDKIFYSLMNYEECKKILYDIPHIRMNNIVVTFRYIIAVDSEGMCSNIVSNHDLTEWSMTKNDVLLLAAVNTLNIFPPRLQLLEDRIKEENPNYVSKGDSPFVLLTNDRNANSAAYILNKDLFNSMADTFRCGFYVFVNCIHECILLPSDKMDNKDAIQCLYNILDNSYEKTKKDEKLSDTLYYYNAETCNLETVARPEGLTD